MIAEAINEGKADWEKNKVLLEKDHKKVEVKQMSSEEVHTAKPSAPKAAAKPAVKKERRAMTKESSI